MTKSEMEELDRQAWEFLKEKDPYYYKKNKLEYKYLSERMRKTRSSIEIPLSSLSNSQRLRCPKMGEMHEWEK